MLHGRHVFAKLNPGPIQTVTRLVAKVDQVPPRGVCCRLHMEAITADIVDALGVHFRRLQVNFLASLLGQIWVFESQVLAIAAGNVIGKHIAYERVDQMVHAPILLPIKPVRFELVMITR